MKITEKAIRYLKIKLGIYQLEKMVNYQAAYLQLTLPEYIVLKKDQEETVRKKIGEKFKLEQFSTAIHKNDLMFAFSIYNQSGSVNQAVTGYFRIGAMVAGNLRNITTTYNLNTRNILDFGAGYGRVSRFLQEVFPAATIYGSEVKKECLVFLEEQLGVKPVYQTAQPESLHLEKMDVILALSVFTHLPQSLFEAWLQKLFSNLNDGGAIIFTYKDASESRDNHGDFTYIKSSEDTGFSFVSDSNQNTDEYGVTYVTRDYLSKLGARTGGTLHFIENKLAPTQKAVILIKPV